MVSNQIEQHQLQTSSKKYRSVQRISFVFFFCLKKDENKTGKTSHKNNGKITLLKLEN